MMSDIEQQWQQDVAAYGDEAYLQYRISLSDKNSFIDATDNNDVEWSISSVNYDVVRRDAEKCTNDDTEQQ